MVAGTGVEVADGLSLVKPTGKSFALSNSGQTRSTPLPSLRGGEPRVI
jgi:hypothetical protein